MKRPAVFFDRDNTLLVNDGYLGDPSKVILMDGAAEAVARARSLGYATVTFSNQSGVARGMFAEEDVERVNSRMDALLIADNPDAKFERHEFCPFHPDGIIDVYKRETDRRKPGAGMILSAAEKLSLDLARSWVVGDAVRDVQAGRAAGCRTILFCPPGIPWSPDAAGAAEGGEQADFTVNSLKEALDVIEKHPEVEEKPQTPEPAAEAVPEAPTAAMPELEPSAAPAPAPAADAPKPDKPWLIAAQMARAKRAAMAAGTPAPAAAATPAPAAPAEPAPPEQPAAATAPEPVESHVSTPAAAPVPESEESPAPIPVAASATLDYRSPGSHPVAPEPEPRPLSPLPASTRLESLAEQILQELRRRNEHDATDFSVTKLLAGIMQMIALAVMFLAYVRGQGATLQTYLLVGIFLQTLTVALLIMTRQK